MSYPESSYFYEKQLRNYILQFMAIFSNLKVKIGTSEDINATTLTETQCGSVSSKESGNEYPKQLITVPIHHGFKDRVVASILADNVQNKPLRLPLMSAALRGLKLNPEMMAGKGTERRQAYVPVGGLLPDDVKVIHQAKPVPYTLSFELAIFASNLDQFFQIMEQIMVIFDPYVQFQITDESFDWKKITRATLVSIDPEFNYPSGNDRRIISSSLAFDVDAWIGVPDSIRRDYIKDIYLRLGVVSNLDKSNEDLLNELDKDGVPYQLVISGDRLSFQ